MEKTSFSNQSNGLIGITEENQNVVEFLNALRLLNHCLKQPTYTSKNDLNDVYFTRSNEKERMASDRYMCYEEWKQAALVIDR